MERDEIACCCLSDLDNFNSHAHVERDYLGVVQGVYVGDFNSHAHVERDRTLSIRPHWKQISTHTLTWSVTIQLFIYVILAKISTHTLTWSVTFDIPEIRKLD